jgi:hypothetical protein
MEGYKAKAYHLPETSSDRLKEIDKMLYQINTDLDATWPIKWQHRFFRG